MKKNNKILLTLITLVVLSFVLIGSSFAWFLVSTTIKLPFSSELTVTQKENLEVSVDIDNDLTTDSFSGTFSSSIDLGTVLDISGNGINLFNPIGFQSEDVPSLYEVATPIHLGDAVKEGDYLELIIKFRSNSELDIYLNEDSSILPYDKTTNMSEYSPTISRDYIAGAARVAILNSAKTSSLLVWDPNPLYQLTKVSESYSFSENGTADTFSALSSYSYITSTTGQSSAFTSSQIVLGNSTLDEHKLITLTKASESDEYYTGSVVVRIWIEGRDRESDICLSGGRIKINLVFNGVISED